MSFTSRDNDFKTLKAFWDKPMPDSAKDSDKLNSYVNESYTESYDLVGASELVGAEDPNKVINEKSGETGQRIGVVAENGELELNDVGNELNDVGHVEPRDKDVAHGSHGFTYVARLVPDNYFDKKHCLENGELKGRRPMPQAFSKDFLSKVTKNMEGKWIFNGVLNEWPSLTTLEVVSMEYVYEKGGVVFSKRYWRADKNGKKEKPYYPAAGLAFFLSTPGSVRVRLRAPGWSSVGFSKNSPGFMYWYNASNEMPRMAHGSNCVSAARLAGHRNVCVRAHHFSHRYPVGARVETFKESLSYHTGVLLEWDHGLYCTVVELAWIGGLGGYGGKCNWFDDKNSGKPLLYETMPACLKMPWRSSTSEIRVLDIKPRNLKEFKTYMRKYTPERFVKPEINHSGPVRLAFREEEHILQYCLNYIQRDTSYSELTRNCQTFALDFAGFLLAKNIRMPNSPMLYFDNKHQFLYEASMFSEKEEKNQNHRYEGTDVEATENKKRDSITTMVKKIFGFGKGEDFGREFGVSL